MAYGHTFADDVKPMVQNRSENFAIYMGTKVNSFQAFEFLFQQVVAESREELRSRRYPTYPIHHLHTTSRLCLLRREEGYRTPLVWPHEKFFRTSALTFTGLFRGRISPHQWLRVAGGYDPI